MKSAQDLIGFFEADRTGVVLRGDPAFVELTGEAEPVGKSVASVVFPDDDAARVFFEGLDSAGARYSARRTEGEAHRWIEVLARRTSDGIGGSLHDVTHRLDAIERYQTLIDHSPFAVVIIQDGVVVYSNEAQENNWPSLGRRADELLHEAMHPDDVEMVVKRIENREAGRSVPENYRYRHVRNGAIRWQEVWSSRVEYQGRPAVQALTLDVTDTMVIEEQLRHSQKTEAIGRLAGGVAHDFNNLLTIIMGAAEIARTSSGMAEVRSELDHVAHAAERASQLTRQLLTFSRRQANHPVVVDVNEVLSRSHKMLARLVGERIQLEFSLASALVSTRIDEGQLEQVITNLVVNARDAMPRGGLVQIDVGRIDVLPSSPHPAGAYVSISVRDAGSGIPPNDVQKIFDPFFTTKDTGKGTGLGLSTVLGIVKEAGGYVDVDSAVGTGTRFTVCLPVWDNTTKVKSSQTPARAQPVAGRILVVEDDDAVRRLITRVLEQAGFETHSAANGPTALRMLRDGLRVELVVSDVTMPEMSGIELESELSALLPKLPVLLVTGYADADVIPTDRKGPVLRKPFAPNALSEIAARLIHESSTSRDQEA